MGPYVDTSFLYSYYSTDAHSTRADLWRQANPVALPLTFLHRLELRNALELAVFQERATVAESSAAWSTMESDIISGLLVESPTSMIDLYANAEKLAAAHTSITGAR